MIIVVVGLFRGSLIDCVCCGCWCCLGCLLGCIIVLFNSMGCYTVAFVIDFAAKGFGVCNGLFVLLICLFVTSLVCVFVSSCSC